MDDPELLEAWRRGDKAAGTALFRRHFPVVRRFFANKVRASDIEDLVQRSFVSLLEGRDQIRDATALRGFLMTVARRTFYRYLRERARRFDKHEPDPHLSSIAELGLSPGAQLELEGLQDRVRTALQQVPVAAQELLELHYWEDMPAPELARLLELEPGAVRTRLHRARHKLLEVLDTEDHEEIERALRELGSKI